MLRAVRDRGEVDRGIQLFERHRKYDGIHLIPHDAVDTAFECLAAPDSEVIASLKNRSEKWNALDVIPVRVRQEDVTLDRRSIGAAEEGATQFPHPSSSVEDDE